MTVEESSDLDKTLESFLGLVGGRLRLNPAVKAVEWLIRRFRYVYECLGIPLESTSNKHL
jgi:hypothetical protein